MSVTIRRSLWEKLHFLKEVSFGIWHKGLDVSISPKAESKLRKNELNELNHDLEMFFMINQGLGFEDFAYSGEMTFPDEKMEYAIYAFARDLKIDPSVDLQQHLLDKILPDLKEVNSQNLEGGEYIVYYRAEKGVAKSATVYFYDGENDHELLLNDHIIELMRSEIRNLLKNDFMYSSGSENIEIIGRDSATFEEVGEADLYFEIVEDEDWEKNY